MSSLRAGRTRQLDKAVERIAARHRELGSALAHCSERHAHDYAVAQDATLDVLVLVIAGHLTDRGMLEADARMEARRQAAELTEQARVDNETTS